jgi:hypothetical protein
MPIVTPLVKAVETTGGMTGAGCPKFWCKMLLIDPSAVGVKSQGFQMKSRGT